MNIRRIRRIRHTQQGDEMPTAKEVQVRACRDEGSEADGETGSIVWCAESDAEFFSVYAGEPGEFKWMADFGDKLVAIQFAKDNAARLGAEFVDRIDQGIS